MNLQKLNFAEINAITEKLSPLYCIYDSFSTFARHPANKQEPKIFRDLVALESGVQQTIGALFFEGPDGVFVHFFDFYGFPKSYSLCTTVLFSFEEISKLSENYRRIQ